MRSMLCTPPQSTYAAASENFTSVLPNMLQLVMDLPLKKLYMEAREDALAEDITGTNLSIYK